jgi:hypothetical protein
LADATQENGEIRSLLGDLEHLQQKIERDQLDAKSTISRLTRPFGLKLAKTIGSHERAVKHYELDVKLIEELPAG